MRRSRLVVAAAIITLCAAPLARASTLTGLDFMSSTVMFEGQSSFSGIAFRTRVQPPSLVKQIEVMPTLEYWRNSNTLHPYEIHAARKDATLGVDVRFNFNNAKWHPYLGAGWAVHFVTQQIDAPSLGIHNADDSVIKGNLAGLGGVSFAMTDRFDNFFELKYHHLSDYRQLKINWGLSYKL